jgi:uncharacterized protein YqjF (DUF2071 family)
MFQSWSKLLFLHWEIPESALRPRLPDRLTIDTFDGKAWIGLTPFTIRNTRPIFIPSIPWLSHFHEVNVRTYVCLDGVPGVWFFSLDANSLLAVKVARRFFHLPYQTARITLEQQDTTIHYACTRKETGPPAEFKGTWTIGDDLPPAQPGSLAFFLTERYCLYAENRGKLYRSRIHHQPWPLQVASVSSLKSTMIESVGLPGPRGEPLLYCGGPVHTEVWPLEKV